MNENELFAPAFAFAGDDTGVRTLLSEGGRSNQCHFVDFTSDLTLLNRF